MQDVAIRDAQPPTPTRRGVLKGLLGFSIISTLVGVLTPIIGYLWPPAPRSAGNEGRVRVASLEELTAAGGLVAPVDGQPVILTYSENAGVRVFSAICTHLGCITQWNAEGSFIHCPCHDGRFNAQTGAVISGPPPSPLPAYDVIIEGDDVFVVL